MYRGTCFQQFALSFGDTEGGYILLPRTRGGCLSALLPRPRGGRLSALFKVWELHWRDRAGQDAFCCSMVLVIVRFASFSVLRRKSL